MREGQVGTARDEDRRVEMHSQFTLTTVTDGEVLIGFDKEKISEKLGL